MVAAEHQRQRATLEDLAHRRFGVAVAGGGIGVHDVRIADVDDAHLVHRQVDGVVLMVVGAAMPEGEERRRLADRPRPETRACAVLGAHVVGNAKHGDVGVDAIPIEHRRPLAEGAVAHERQIETALLVGMHSTPPGLLGIKAFFRLAKKGKLTARLGRA